LIGTALHPLWLLDCAPHGADRNMAFAMNLPSKRFAAYRAD
jgi:hypothetical protein